MAESASSKAMFDRAGEGAVAGEIDRAAVPEAVLTEDGVPVVDLRAATDAGGVFVVVDGTLLMRLADGTEWPIDPTTADGSVVLQLTDQDFVAASSIQAALAGADTALPLTSLVAATIQATTIDGETVGDAAPAAEPEAAGAAPVHGGGAAFRTYEVQELGSGLDPVLALGPTDLGFGSNPFADDLAGLAASTPGNGGRFINLAPIANDDLAVTNEQQAITIDVLANDRDPNIGDTIRIVAVDSADLHGVVTLNPDGTITYDPNGQFTHLAVDELATETFGYTVADQQGRTNQATVTVEITGVNDAPVAVDDHFVGFEKIGFYAPIEALLANDYDVDHGDTFHFAGIGNAVSGEVSLTPDGYVVFTPDAGYVGPAGFQYAIQDQHGAYDIGEVYVDVRPITPGDIEFQTLTWFAALSDIVLVEHADGSLQLDMLIEVGALATVGVEIGGMPFFSAVITGELLGAVNVSVDPSGQPQAVGNVLGFLDMQIYQSPIFEPLGSDFYDALLLATSAPPLPSGDPGYPALPGELDDLLALAFDMLGQQGLGGGPIGAPGEGAALGSALSFGNGTFYLDIAGVLDGLVVVDGDGTQSTPVAELFGQFAAAVAIDIRDGVDVVADGFLDGGYETATSGFGQGLSIGGAVGELVSEEAALAA